MRSENAKLGITGAATSDPYGSDGVPSAPCFRFVKRDVAPMSSRRARPTRACRRSPLSRMLAPNVLAVHLDAERSDAVARAEFRLCDGATQHGGATVQ